MWAESREGLTPAAVELRYRQRMADAVQQGSYQEHPVFTPPSDRDTGVWRYMDFAKLVSLLATQALFFARAESLNDPFEGSYPRLTSPGEVMYTRRFLLSNSHR